MAHHILPHTFNAEDTLNTFHLSLPSYTVDFYLINIICAGLTLPFQYNPLPFHPFTRSVQLDLSVMQALPVPPFRLKKCYGELIQRVLKDAHKRWKHRNTQLSQSVDLVDHVWTPCTRTSKA